VDRAIVEYFQNRALPHPVRLKRIDERFEHCGQRVQPLYLAFDLRDLDFGSSPSFGMAASSSGRPTCCTTCTPSAMGQRLDDD